MCRDGSNERYVPQECWVQTRATVFGFRKSRFWDGDALRFFSGSESHIKFMSRILFPFSKVGFVSGGQVLYCSFSDMFWSVKEERFVVLDVAFVNKPISKPIKRFGMFLPVLDVRQCHIICKPTTPHPSLQLDGYFRGWLQYDSSYSSCNSVDREFWR
jgi:hypothetical protein